MRRSIAVQQLNSTMCLFCLLVYQMLSNRITVVLRFALQKIPFVNKVVEVNAKIILYNIGRGMLLKSLWTPNWLAVCDRPLPILTIRNKLIEIFNEQNVNQLLLRFGHIYYISCTQYVSMHVVCIYSQTYYCYVYTFGVSMHSTYIVDV